MHSGQGMPIVRGAVDLQLGYSLQARNFPEFSVLITMGLAHFLAFLVGKFLGYDVNLARVVLLVVLSTLAFGIIGAGQETN